ncbi:MAG: NAD(P)/FAD-dependent oxidoreductase [Methylovirgula sp.]
MTFRPSRPKQLVLVGNGMAGMRAIEDIIARAPERYAVTIFGAEPHGNYDRILLSSLLAGEKDFENIVLHGHDWYQRHGITLYAGERIVDIDRTAREVISETGRRTPYDVLILATGSLPIMLPIQGAALPGVLTFRTIADVEAMQRAAEKSGKAIVIGGGLLGLEAAYGLKRRGMEVTVLHLMPHLMERQLDPVAGAMLKQDLAQRGIEVITNACTEAILGRNHVTGIVLADGREIPADLVVMAVGIRPNVALAQSSGLAVNRGIEIDDRLATSDPAIYAIGECVEHRGDVFGLVAPLYQMARTLSERLCGNDDAFYETVASATRLKVTGIDMFSAGDIYGDEDSEILMFRDAARGIYKRLVMRDTHLVGTLLYGEVRDGLTYLDLMQKHHTIPAAREALMFSPRTLENSAQEAAA